MSTSQFSFVSAPKNCDDHVKEITVRLDGESEPILIIPIEDEPEEDPLHTEYVNVRIQVEPDESKKKTEEELKTECKNEKPSRSAKERSYVCSLCSKAFATRQHLDRHFNLHSMETLYPCEDCDKVLLDRSYLLRHMRIHVGERHFKCSTCEKAFLTPSSLKRHETIHNPDLRNHVCVDCGKRFPDNSSLKKHSHLHSGVKTHVCTICAKGFSHVGDYNIHLRSHDPVKQYRCDDCGKEFSRHNNMVRHKAVHSGGGNHICDTCNVSFQHAGTLTRHIISCHPEKANVKRTDVHSVPVASEEYPDDEDEDQEEEEDDEDTADEDDVHAQHEVKPTMNFFNVKSEPYVHIAEDSHQMALVKSSPSSFEIYKLDASGVLQRITDSVSVQIVSQNGQVPSEVIHLRNVT